MLSGDHTGNIIPHDEYNICCIAHANAERKDNIYMQRLVQNLKCGGKGPKANSFVQKWFCTPSGAMDPNFRIRYIPSRFVLNLMEILIIKQIPLFLRHSVWKLNCPVFSNISKKNVSTPFGSVSFNILRRTLGMRTHITAKISNFQNLSKITFEIS